MTVYLSHLFAWLPPLLEAALGIVFAIVVLVIVFKVIAFILDFIPFV